MTSYTVFEIVKQSQNSTTVVLDWSYQIQFLRSLFIHPTRLTIKRVSKVNIYELKIISQPIARNDNYLLCLLLDLLFNL
jgi:hypothetical protein